MTEKDYKPKHQEKGLDMKQKPEIKAKPADAKSSENKIEAKPAEVQEAKKPVKQEIKKKDEAVAKGLNLHASKKHCMYISDFIKNKPIDQAISELQEVTIMKRVIPYKGEIPHRKQHGIMSGRYPVKASKQIIYVLKALKGNVMANGMDLDKARISYASASWASRPAKKGGMRFKRVHLILKAREFEIPAKPMKKNKNQETEAKK